MVLRVSKIEGKTQQGTPRDAIPYSCEANRSYGLRRTDTDKHRQVTRLVEDEEWKEWSDNKIAQQYHVSHFLVGQIWQKVIGFPFSIGTNCDAPETQETEAKPKKHA